MKFPCRRSVCFTLYFLFFSDSACFQSKFLRLLQRLFAVTDLTEQCTGMHTVQAAAQRILVLNTCRGQLVIRATDSGSNKSCLEPIINDGGNFASA